MQKKIAPEKKKIICYIILIPLSFCSLLLRVSDNGNMGSVSTMAHKVIEYKSANVCNGFVQQKPFRSDKKICKLFYGVGYLSRLTFNLPLSP